MDNASVGAVGSSTICHGPLEESHPPMHQVIGIHTLAVDPAVAHKLAPDLLNHSPGVPGEQS